MVGTIVHQLTKNASIEEIEAAGLGPYYTDQGIYVNTLLYFKDSLQNCKKLISN